MTGPLRRGHVDAAKCRGRDHVKTQEKRATYKPRRANAGLRLPASRAVKKQIFAV